MDRVDIATAGAPAQAPSDAWVPGRVRGLDGLRGYAAVAVVLNHSLIVYPWILAVHTSEERVARPGIGWFVLTHTPVHLFWLGLESVMTFFVLSGVALAMAARSTSFSWRSYYPSRLVRLYLPVWAAFALGVVVFVLVTRHGSAPWLGDRVDRLGSPAHVVGDTLLVGGADTFVGPMWSLRWELAFSLLLPLYLFLSRWRAVGTAVKVVAIFVVIGVANLALRHTLIGEALTFLPIFALGCLMATHWDHLAAAAGRIDGLPRARTVWAGWLAATLIGLTAYWIALGLSASPVVSQAVQLVSVASAASLVLHAAFNPALRGFLGHRVSQWLGRVSFSLYLVHAPLLSALEASLPTAARPLVMLLGLPLALAAAWVFHRVVESPSHRLAKRIAARSRSADHHAASRSDVQDTSQRCDSAPAQQQGP